MGTASYSNDMQLDADSGLAVQLVNGVMSLQWRRCIIERAVFNYIAKVLQDYPHIDEYVREREDELRHPYREPDKNIGGGKSNVMTNSSELMAITIADDRRLANLERQRNIVDCCLAKSDSATITVIHELYFKNSPTLTLQGVAEKLSYANESSIRKKRNRFFELMQKELGI